MNRIKVALKLDFERRVLLQLRGSTITSDAGLLPNRELDDTIGLSVGRDTGTPITPLRHGLSGLGDPVI